MFDQVILRFDEGMKGLDFLWFRFDQNTRSFFE